VGWVLMMSSLGRVRERKIKINAARGSGEGVLAKITIFDDIIVFHSFICT